MTPTDTVTVERIRYNEEVGTYNTLLKRMPAAIAANYLRVR